MSNRIAIAGDWHGDTGSALAMLNILAKHNITNIQHVGDFGIWGGHDGASFLRKVNKRLGVHGQTLYVTLGNHEDYVRAGAFIAREDGWLTRADVPNILIAPRGHRYTIGGRSFVSLGGANSIDRDSRTPNVSWWAEEQISLGDAYRTIAGGHADVFLAHEAPAGARLFSGNEEKHGNGWAPSQIAYANESRFMMRKVVDEVKPDLYFHGHYHHLLKHDTILTDGAGDEYPFKGYCLQMNGYDGNLAILDLDTMESTFPSVR